MPSCRLCGADVLYASTAAGEPLVLDTVSSAAGPDRYRPADEMGRVFEPVPPAASVSAPTLHRVTCPYADANVGGGRALAARSAREGPSG